MTTELDERLRAALHAVPREVPPADLTTTALTRARRSRRRAVTGLVAVVAVLAAAAVTVPTVVLRRAAAPQTANQPTEPITGFMVTAYTTIADPYNGKIPKVAPPVLSYPPTVYSPSQRRYVTPPWRIALPSPDGRRFAVSNAAPPPGRNSNVLAPPGPVGVVPADRIDDPTAVRWVPGVETLGGSGQFSWEADSRHFVVRTAPVPPARLELVDAQTLATRSLDLAVEQDEIVRSLPVVPPDGRGFALIVEPAGATGTTRYTVRFYDERGARTRQVHLVGTFALPSQVDQPFSPDGRFVALAESDATDIADTTSGRPVLWKNDGVFARWYDEEHFIAWGGVSTGRRLLRLVELRTGRAVARKVVAPVGQMLTGLWVAPVRGTPPPGAVVL